MGTMLNTKATHPTQAVFGVDGEGKPFSMNISEGPHWIVAGQSGSGKSVFVNAINFSIFCHTHPSELWLTWIDPKKVEAIKYKGLPHCPVDPITDMQDASAFLTYLTWLMDERYSWLEETSLKKIDDFNDKIDTDPEYMAKFGHTEKIPFWIIVIDEYADMVAQNKDVEKDIVRIGQKARACGIHIIVATQRPSADIITPNLKSNAGCRAGLKTTDGTNSSIIMGDGFTECSSLRGNGDCYIKHTEGITRVQGPYITDDEIDAIAEDLLGRWGPATPFDYKTKVMEVQPDKYEWADEYTDDVPMSKRHLVAKKKSFMR